MCGGYSCEVDICLNIYICIYVGMCLRVYFMLVCFGV